MLVRVQSTVVVLRWGSIVYTLLYTLLKSQLMPYEHAGLTTCMGTHIKPSTMTLNQTKPKPNSSSNLINLYVFFHFTLFLTLFDPHLNQVYFHNCLVNQLSINHFNKPSCHYIFMCVRPININTFVKVLLTSFTSIYEMFCFFFFNIVILFGNGMSKILEPYTWVSLKIVGNMFGGLLISFKFHINEWNFIDIGK